MEVNCRVFEDTKCTHVDCMSKEIIGLRQMVADLLANPPVPEKKEERRYQVACRNRHCSWGVIHTTAKPEDKNCPRCHEPFDIMSERI